MPRGWAELIAEGRQLVEQETRCRWELGDLALEIAPMGEDASHNGAYEKLSTYAEAIGIEFKRLGQYRDVASKWSPNTLVVGASWTIHREYMGEPDRARILRRMSEAAPAGRLTVDLARMFRGSPMSRPDATGLVERFEETDRRLRESAPEVSDHLRQLREERQREIDSGEYAAREERVEAGLAPIVSGFATLGAVGLVRQAEQFAKDVRHAVNHRAEIGLDDVARIRKAAQDVVEMLDGFADGQHLDDALTRILAGES
jgi:hypothetical protein